LLEPTRQLNIVRNTDQLAAHHRDRSVDEPRSLHRLDDPEVGDTLFVSPRSAGPRLSQAADFVEFRALPRPCIVIQPLADDLTVESRRQVVSAGRAASPCRRAGPTNKRTAAFAARVHPSCGLRPGSRLTIAR